MTYLSHTAIYSHSTELKSGASIVRAVFHPKTVAEQKSWLFDGMEKRSPPSLFSTMPLPSKTVPDSFSKYLLIISLVTYQSTPPLPANSEKACGEATGLLLILCMFTLWYWLDLKIDFKFCPPFKLVTIFLNRLHEFVLMIMLVPLFRT